MEFMRSAIPNQQPKFLITFYKITMSQSFYNFFCTKENQSINLFIGQCLAKRNKIN